MIVMETENNNGNKIIKMVSFPEAFRIEWNYYTDAMKEMERLEEAYRQTEEKPEAEDAQLQQKLDADMAESLARQCEQAEKKQRRRPNRQKIQAFEEICKDAQLLAQQVMLDIAVDLNDRGDGSIRFRFDHLFLDKESADLIGILSRMAGDCAGLRFGSRTEREGASGGGRTELDFWFELYDLAEP